MRSRINFGTEMTGVVEGQVALAIRPAASDGTGLFFSFNRRSRDTTGIAPTMSTRDRVETASRKELTTGEWGQGDKEKKR